MNFGGSRIVLQVSAGLCMDFFFSKKGEKKAIKNKKKKRKEKKGERTFHWADQQLL
jgi:hypothetical protein